MFINVLLVFIYDTVFCVCVSGCQVYIKKADGPLEHSNAKQKSTAILT